ncbi:MAG: M28 family peptidase [Xanthomarina sp.]
MADDVLRGRETGSPEIKIAASYLANSFRSYGVKPNPKTGTYYQDVKLKRVSPPKDVSITLNNQVITDYIFINATKMTSNQDAIFLDYGLADDYKGKDLKGKIVIVKAGSPETSDGRAAFGLRGTKEKLAKDHGVIAIIELLKVDEDMWRGIGHNFSGPTLTIDSGVANQSEGKETAYVWVLDKDGKMAEQLSAVKKISSKIAIGEKHEEAVDCQNVIGVVEGTDPKLKNEYIIYSAHYDHVGIGAPDATGDTIYNGARDNAVGTTTVLSMAKSLAKYPTKRSALFILFTGEERGLLGSSYYVENPVLPLNQMVYCFNSDNAGYNDTSVISVIGLTRTTAEKNIFNAAEAFGLKAIEDPAKEQGLFDRSDNVNFAKKGIPAPTFSLGFTTFDGDVTKYYHQAGDEADTLDYDYLLKFFNAYVLAGRNIGNDPKTPIWNQGDKYEAVSKELYKVKATKN